MVEVLFLVVIIVAIRAVYLGLFREKEKAKGLVEKSANDIN